MKTEPKRKCQRNKDINQFFSSFSFGMATKTTFFCITSHWIKNVIIFFCLLFFLYLYLIYSRILYVNTKRQGKKSFFYIISFLFIIDLFRSRFISSPRCATNNDKNIIFALFPFIPFFTSYFIEMSICFCV